ncbi:MAG TPA: helix-turn-helix domain-containing protein, partial [Candidatus Peribacteria bacterium]|nr:helix-turn-helix domain-containing protein [Candidatus Peribacteria bacterium]
LQYVMAFPRQQPAKHLPKPQIRKRYESCTEPVERKQWRALWLLSAGRTPLSAREVALQLGCTSDWVRKILRRYNQFGPAALRDGRKRNGRAGLLSDMQFDLLRRRMALPLPDGERWTGALTARAMEELLGRDVDAVTGWRYLKKLTAQS